MVKLFSLQISVILITYNTSQKFLNSKIFNVFIKKSLLLTKPAFI